MIPTDVPGIYLTPVCIFGKFNYLTEPIHQNIEGNKYIARELAPIVLECLNKRQ